MRRNEETVARRDTTDVRSARRMMSEEQLDELRVAMDKLVRAVEEKLSGLSRPQPAPLLER